MNDDEKEIDWLWHSLFLAEFLRPHKMNTRFLTSTYHYLMQLAAILASHYPLIGIDAAHHEDAGNRDAN